MSAPTIEVHPNSTDIIEGEEVTLTLCGISSDLTFKWEKKGIRELNDPGYSGKESNKLTIRSYSSSNHDGEYYCKVSRGDGSIISSSAALKGMQTSMTYPVRTLTWWIIRSIWPNSIYQNF